MSEKIQFSTAIDGLSPEEEAWLLSDMAMTDQTLREMGKNERELWLESHKVKNIEEWPDFEWRFEGEELRLLRIYSMDVGCVEQVAALMHEFLKRFRPGKFLWFSWAVTDTVPTIDNFGGGAAFVTDKGIQSWSVQDLVVAAQTEHLRERTSPGKRKE